MNVRHVASLSLVSGLLALPVGGFLLGLLHCSECGLDLARRGSAGLWLALMTPLSFGFPATDSTGNTINAWPWILPTWVVLYVVLERMGRRSSKSPSRLIAGLAAAPLVFLLVVALYQVMWGARSDLLVAYGVYAYLFAVMVGSPVLWVLLRTGRTGLATIAVAGAGIAGASVGILAVLAPGLYEIGVPSRVDVAVAVLGGAVAGLAFWQIAGLAGRDAGSRESKGTP